MDIERAKFLDESSDWKALQGEIDRLIKFEEYKLKSCDADDLKAIQMKIKAYEQVKIVPKSVIEREE